MVRGVQTTEAVQLGCVIFYTTRGPCRYVLSFLKANNAHYFPDSEIPTELIRLRIAAQRDMGLLHLAAAAAEDVLRLDPSRENFLALATLYFEKGDFASLVLHARRHEKFEDLSTSLDLLQLAYRLQRREQDGSH